MKASINLSILVCMTATSAWNFKGIRRGGRSTGLPWIPDTDSHKQFFLYYFLFCLLDLFPKPVLLSFK